MPPPSRKRKPDTSSEASTTTSSISKSEAVEPSSQEEPTSRKPAKSPRKGGGKSGQSTGGGGRVRLPDKLLKHLNGEPMPDVIWWMPDGNGFAYNIGKVQNEFLDKHFGGTKLASFVRSLNRW